MVIGCGEAGSRKFTEYDIPALVGFSALSGG